MDAAWLKFNEGHLDEALAVLAEAGDGLPDALLLEGYRHFLEEDWELALEQFQELRTKRPLDANLLQLTSFCLSELGRRQEALQLLEKGIEIEPENEEIRAQLTETRFEQAVRAGDARDWNEALRILESLVTEHPKQPEYLLQRAYYLQQSGKLDAAVVDYRRGLELAPNSRWARTNLASCLYLLGRFEAAASEFARLANREPTADVFFQLGLCYSHLQRDIEAERSFEKALKLGGERPDVLYNLGIARIRLLKLHDGWGLVRHSAKLGYRPARELLRRAGLVGNS